MELVRGRLTSIWGTVKSEMLARHPNRDARSAVGWMSLEFTGEISARDFNVGVFRRLHNTDELSC